MGTIRQVTTAIATFTVAMLFMAAAPVSAASLEQLANGDQRSPENIARNAARHPVQTLEFFGLKPDSTVVELTPGGGWYTEIIAPYVNEKGQYYGANYDRQMDAPFIKRVTEGFRAKLDSRPELYGNAKVTDLSTTDDRPIAPDGSADLVVSFRNLHDWIIRDQADTVFAKVFKALKPGGTFGIVEAREAADKPQELKKHVGYVRQDYAIKIIEAAGFKFVGASEANANPKDTHDWGERGVFGMPKGFEGESDRFTLKFQKPE